MMAKQSESNPEKVTKRNPKPLKHRKEGTTKSISKKNVTAPYA